MHRLKKVIQLSIAEWLLQPHPSKPVNAFVQKFFLLLAGGIFREIQLSFPGNNTPLLLTHVQMDYV